MHFTHTDGGLVVKGEKLGEFSIAGEDHKWYWADARIEGDTIVVSSPPCRTRRKCATHGNRIRRRLCSTALACLPFPSGPTTGRD